MLNPFPIQFLALLAYFILRIFVGALLIYLGIKHYKFRHELKHVFILSWWPYGYFSALTLALSELVIGGLLVMGAYTQYAALALILMSLKLLIVRNRFDHHALPTKLTYFLLFGAALSLFITGAGALAFDLPI